MKNKNAIQWLYSELSSLVKQKIISESAADNLRKHYGKIEPVNKVKAIITAFAVIGAILMGLGVILIFAYNWDNFSRPFKAFLSYVPLLVSLSLAWFVVTKRADSAAWREGIAVFWSLSVGATIALVSQTYNISGNMADYIFIWLILIAPVIYILDAIVAALVYMILLIIWVSCAQLEGGTGWFFWVFFAAMMPFFISKIKQDNYGRGTIFLAWLVCACLTAGTGIALEKCVPGLWIIIYISLFVGLYLLGDIVFGEGETYFESPFQAFGITGAAFLSWLLTFTWPWKEIGWYNYRATGLFHAEAGIVDYVLALVLPVISLTLLFKFIKERKKTLVDLGVAPLFAILAYAGVSFVGNEHPAVLIMNAYVLYLAVSYIYNGIKNASFTAANGGMLLFSMLVIARFFDVDMSILWRGLIFIALGAGFLTSNIVISRRKGVAK